MAAKLKQVKVYVQDYEYIAKRARYGETFAEAFRKAIKPKTKTKTKTSKRSHSPVTQVMTAQGGEKH